MKCNVAWRGAKIPQRAKKIIVKICLGLGVLLLGAELSPILSYLFMKYSTASDGVLQRVMFLFPNVPFGVLLWIVAIIAAIVFPFLF